MSKKYLNIGEHGLNGDFYRDPATENGAFRADNLEIATRIAFNNYLRDFDNLWREMNLVKIETGKFTVDIYSLDPRHTHGKHHTETHTVEYYGPADMFTIEFEQDHCDDPEYRQMITAMEMAQKRGEPTVRISNRTGRVMFSNSVRFPRFTPDGEWFPWEHPYLNTDLKIARLQMQIAGITY